MYNPFSPNNYLEVKIAQYRRAKQQQQEYEEEEEQKKNINNSNIPILQNEGMHNLNNSSLPLQESDRRVGLSLSAEEIYRRRVQKSAASGIDTAIKIERESYEAEHKMGVSMGTDKKSKIQQQLAKLREKATLDNNNNNDNIGIGGSVIFERSDVAPGVYVPKVDTSSAVRKKKIVSGKPSSTILVRFTNLDKLPATYFINEGGPNEDNRNKFLKEIVEKCGRFGVVRSFNYEVRRENEEKECDEVDTEFLLNKVRIFLRLDSVTSAFVAAEYLNKDHDGYEWDISFLANPAL